MNNSLLAIVLLGVLTLVVACGQGGSEFSVSSEVVSVDEAVSSFPEYAQEAVQNLTGNQQVTRISVTGEPVPSADKLVSLAQPHLGQTPLGTIKTPNYKVLLIEQASTNSFVQMVEGAAKLAARKVATEHGYHFYLAIGEDF